MALKTSVADPGCLSGSEIFQLRVPGLNPHKKIQVFLTQKIVSYSQKYDRIMIFYPSRIPDPGVEKAPEPGSRIRNTAQNVSDSSHEMTFGDFPLSPLRGINIGRNKSNQSLTKT